MVTKGQRFVSEDGGIEVTVRRVGNKNEKAIFGVRNLRNQRANYTVFIFKKSGGDPDRIQYKTDDPPTKSYETSADETVKVEIKLDASR